MKVAFVLNDPHRLGALTAVFRAHYGDDLSLEVTDNALSALTWLERHPPDLIVSGGDVGMSGADFLEIVRADPTLQAVPFILLDETALGRLVPGAHELVLEAHTSPAVVLGAATSLLGRTQPDVTSPWLEGTTGLVSPFDLITLLTGENRSGRLSFALPQKAVFWYARGRLVHAEYAQLVGERALIAAFTALYEGDSVRFSYCPEPPSAETSPQITLHRPLELLLLETALELDLRHRLAE